ncbi:ethyl tert-butyl ether degradation protein EthD [Paraburkholderia guartelaensis]|uniref:Ethyl tert-butyl ether degradation protein EthD n=1 Tax=Paraburkholderia guartelaensis TaxID=2546446 RepID=A0A4R5L2L5_9BURK|nr:ethyl tert-butyl ether degradation protein EthD [Paraburkholderia guartelaensis]TDG02841.1 ethyl tert-butyl ether degradation protein EthD [Paraburkholderia guartelaensis]
MQVCLFLTGEGGAEPPVDVHALQREAREIDGLCELVAHLPIAKAVDPRIAPAPQAPSCILQWYFSDLVALEAELAANGAVDRALRRAALAMDAHSFSQQTMAVQTFTPPQRTALHNGMERCSYMVAYEGPTEDFNVWLTHYLAHHPPLMLQLPALRELEIYTPVESRSALPFACTALMQRNKVVFDDADALAHALASPVRDAMRRDFQTLPPYSGATPHYPMRSIYGKFAAP